MEYLFSGVLYSLNKIVYSEFNHQVSISKYEKTH